MEGAHSDADRGMQQDSCGNSSKSGNSKAAIAIEVTSMVVMLTCATWGPLYYDLGAPRILGPPEVLGFPPIYGAPASVTLSSGEKKQVSKMDAWISE